MECSKCVFRGMAIYRAAGPALMGAVAKARQGSASFNKGQLIMADQREGRSVYTVTSGWAFTYVLLKDGRRQILDYHTVGDFLTLPTLLQSGIRASVRALTDVEACCFDVDVLRDLLHQHDELMPGVLSYLGEKKTQSDARLTTLGALSAEEAIAVLIMTFVERAATRAEDDTPILFPLKLAEIADAVGITQIHAGRVIRRLEERGALERRGNEGFAVDLDSLRQVTQEVAPVLFDG